MSDMKKGTQFMRGAVKWASVLTPNTTFEPTFQASIYQPMIVDNSGEIVDSDSDSIIASFENRGFKHSVKTDKETNEKFLFFKRKAVVKRPRKDASGKISYKSSASSKSSSFSSKLNPNLGTLNIPDWNFSLQKK